MWWVPRPRDQKLSDAPAEMPPLRVCMTGIYFSVQPREKQPLIGSWLQTSCKAHGQKPVGNSSEEAPPGLSLAPCPQTQRGHSYINVHRLYMGLEAPGPARPPWQQYSYLRG